MGKYLIQFLAGSDAQETFLYHGSRLGLSWEDVSQ